MILLNSNRKLPYFFFWWLLFTTSLYAQSPAAPASTPPMGWNSYNCFGSAVHEPEVKANADYMAANLKQHGWQYIVVDFLWSYPNPPGSTIGNPFQKNLEDGSYIPWLTMDSNGRLLPDEKKFPSAFGGNGFKPLADYVHKLGLKFGIHIMRGIPRQAVWAKATITGTNITADKIADTTSICPWLNHMYGLDMNKPGAQEYLNSLLALYAGWGVDYIKVDDISRPYHKAEIEGYHKAIAACSRAMVLSLSPGETPVAEATHVQQYSNLWRLADDFWDNWKEILHMFDYARRWQGTGGPGHWPDCDMMQVGKLSKRGPVGPERYSRFTEDELYTHLTFWSIYRSPLMLGGNLPENRPLEVKLLTNDKVLAVNQRGENPHEIYRKDSCSIWVSKAPGKGNWNVALFNLNDAPHEVTIDFNSLLLKEKCTVTDLWADKEIGYLKKKYSRLINAHGAALLLIQSK